MLPKRLSVEKTPPLYLRIYQTLKEAIVRGDLAPGEQIIETKLAEELNVSRTPIREALRQLSKDGLIVTQDNGTTTVFEPTVYDVAEIYIMRASLEAKAASIVAATEDKGRLIHDLYDILSKAEQANKEENVKKFVEYNTEFHQKILYSSKNNRLIENIESIHLQILQIRSKSLSNFNHRSASLEEHYEIVKRLEKGDYIGVKDFVATHILKAGFRVIEFLGVPKETTPSIQYLKKYR